MTVDVMTLFLTGLLSGSSLAAALETYRWWKDKRDKSSFNFNIVLENIHKVYSVLDKLRKDIGCERVLILKAHNGGGIPAPDTSVYSSILYESSSAQVENLKSNWQNQLIDKPYAELLLDIYKNDRVKLVTNDTKPSILKAVYEANNVTVSYVYRISTKFKRFIYLSIHFIDQERGHELTAQQEDAIRIAKTELIDIFDKTKYL